MIILFVILTTAHRVTGDHFDVIQNKMRTVDASNCHQKTKDDLQLPASALPQDALPVFLETQVEEEMRRPSRSLLMEASKMALNRALFYSYTNQKLNASRDFYKMPDISYYYLSAVSSMTASPDGIVGAGIYYDQNTSYPNWYRYLDFNCTVNLFAPYAVRIPKEQHTGVIHGVKVEDDSVRNYTKTTFETNDLYRLWLPDKSRALDSEKATYSIKLIDSGNPLSDSYSYFSFYGPSISNVNKNIEPVRFTQPYFDCGRTDTWTVTAVSPVLDVMNRYVNFKFLRRQRFVAESVVDVDFTKIDINQCPLSQEDAQPNFFAGTHKCKPSTWCKPVNGFGFRRGGYECPCRYGYVYKDSTATPFQGVDIEKATAQEYKHGFECVYDGVSIIVKRDHTAVDIDHTHEANKEKLQRLQNITETKCALDPTQVDDLIPSSKSLQQHLEPQAREAVRFSHFLSSYLQTSFDFGSSSTLKPRFELNQDEIHAEGAAIALSDPHILSVLAYVNVKLPNGTGESMRTYVNKNWTSNDNYGPFDYELSSSVPKVEVTYKYEISTNWTINWLDSNIVDVLAKERPHADNLSKLPTWTYKVPSVETGEWLGAPSYMCSLKQWKMTYAVPVVGPVAQEGDSVKFMGQVVIHVRVPTSILFM